MINRMEVGLNDRPLLSILLIMSIFRKRRSAMVKGGQARRLDRPSLFRANIMRRDGRRYFVAVTR